MSLGVRPPGRGAVFDDHVNLGGFEKIGMILPRLDGEGHEDDPKINQAKQG